MFVIRSPSWRIPPSSKAFLATGPEPRKRFDNRTPVHWGGRGPYRLPDQPWRPVTVSNPALRMNWAGWRRRLFVHLNNEKRVFDMTDQDDCEALAERLAKCESPRDNEWHPRATNWYRLRQVRRVAARMAGRQPEALYRDSLFEVP